MKVWFSICLAAALAGCATPKNEPAAICRSAVMELRECAETVRQWQSQEVEERPECIGEDAATPAAAAVTEYANSHADQPDRHAALQEVARRLDLANKLLKHESLAQAEVMLRDIEARCAKLQ